MASINRNTLDKFGPYGSAIGSVVGAAMIAFSPHSFLRYCGLFFAPFLAYVFCTCVHRKYKIYSNAALGGSIGAIIGIYLGAWVGYFAALATASFLPFTYFVWGVFTALPSFLLSRHMCKRAQKKKCTRKKQRV